MSYSLTSLFFPSYASLIYVAAGAMGASNQHDLTSTIRSWLYTGRLRESQRLATYVYLEFEETCGLGTDNTRQKT
ncbi:MAG: hypothetical protein ABWK00_06590 [Desulfurococcaceae archaeon]